MVGGATAAPPSAAPATPVVATPSECDAVDLIADATITGEDLGACVVAYSVAAGTVHEYLQAGDATGEADVVFGETPSMAGSLTTSEGTQQFVLTADAAWLTFDGEWVQGDESSADPRAIIASTVGRSYRAYALPAVAAALFEAAPSWTVQPGRDTITFPDGRDRSAWRIQSDGPFPALGGTVQQMVLWLADGHVPVGTQATVDVGGVQNTTVQQYADWGAPVTIRPPQG